MEYIQYCNLRIHDWHHRCSHNHTATETAPQPQLGRSVNIKQSFLCSWKNCGHIGSLSLLSQNHSVPQWTLTNFPNFLGSCNMTVTAILSTNWTLSGLGHFNKFFWQKAQHAYCSQLSASSDSGTYFTLLKVMWQKITCKWWKMKSKADMCFYGIQFQTTSAFHSQSQS